MLVRLSRVSEPRKVREEVRTSCRGTDPTRGQPAFGASSCSFRAIPFNGFSTRAVTAGVGRTLHSSWPSQCRRQFCQPRPPKRVYTRTDVIDVDLLEGDEIQFVSSLTRPPLAVNRHYRRRQPPRKHCWSLKCVFFIRF